MKHREPEMAYVGDMVVGPLVVGVRAVGVRVGAAVLNTPTIHIDSSLRHRTHVTYVRGMRGGPMRAYVGDSVVGVSVVGVAAVGVRVVGAAVLNSPTVCTDAAPASPP